MNRLIWTQLIWLFLCILAPWNGSCAIPGTNAVQTVRSSSRQFIAHGVPLVVDAALSFNPQPPGATIRVDPALLAVSCERIKTAFLTELGLRDSWKGKIHLFIRFIRSPQKPIEIYPHHYREGWQYHLIIPDEVDSMKLARAVVQVLLLELANRRSDSRLSEIPLWLSEGFLHHLLATSGRDLILQPFTKITQHEVRRTAWEIVQERLQNRVPLTFNQLSLPTPDYLKGEAWEAYQATAHLLVYQLLSLPQGPTPLVSFLQQLPAVLNWQTSFLAAYRNQFSRLIDVEKWWAISLVNLRNGEQLHGWSVMETGSKLDEMLNLSAQIRQQPHDLPVPTHLTMQRILEQWDYSVQKNILQAKINQLTLLQIYSAPQLIPLLSQYMDVLTRYLEVLNRAGVDDETKSRPPRFVQITLRQTIQRLDDLDKQRQLMRNQIASQAQ